MASSSQPFCPISVIFVTYNSAETIGAAISSAVRHLPDAEIIVVDNGSTDRTVDIVRATVARLIHGHGNIGFGAGVNLGVHVAKHDLVLVLNPDTVVMRADPVRLRGLTRCAKVGIIGCGINSDGANFLPIYAEWGWRRELSWAMLQWFLVPRGWGARRPNARSIPSRPWISGAAFMVSRREFLAIGGFDEAIFLYFEDQDLSRQYRQHDATLRVTDAVVITHDGQGSAQHCRERTQSWALLSLMELVSKWRGCAEAERAARSTLRQLSAVSVLGQVAARLPVVGAHAKAKSRSAALVKSMLLAEVASVPANGVYARARAAFVAVQDNERQRCLP